MKDWYYLVPPISWIAICVYYMRKRPAYSGLSNWEKIDRNMGNSMVNIKCTIGNVVLTAVIVIAGIVIRIIQ